MQFLRSSFSKVPKHKRFDYSPRFEREKKSEEPSESRIFFERGKLYKNSKNTFNHLRSDTVTHSEKRRSKSKNRAKLLLLVLMMATIYGYFTINVASVALALVALGFILILLVLYIRLNNSY